MATLNQWLLRRNLKTILPRKKEERKEKRIEKERVLVNNNATILALIIPMAKNKYRTLSKEGPWAMHLRLGQDWGMGRYSRYQYRVYTRRYVGYPH